MFIQDRETVLAGLGRLGALTCGYTIGDADDWLNGHCDCKYGGPKRSPHLSEENGCPELRVVHALVVAMTDEEWAALVTRSGSFEPSVVAEAFASGLVSTADERHAKACLTTGGCGCAQCEAHRQSRAGRTT